MKAIRVRAHGGPEVLQHEDIDLPQTGPDEVLVRIAAAGLNFIDIYHRKGIYKLPKPPFTLGSEAAGTVEALGDDVEEFRVGDRVAYAMVVGAFAEYAVVKASRLVKLPNSMDFPAAAAIMLQGMTAHYLTHSCFPLNDGHTALVHAAAGGVGLLLTQVARKLGATVYATVGSEAKAELARGAGANEVIIYTRQDFETEVKALTGGQGVDVVYDSVGASTFNKSLNCLRPRGYLILFGQSSGAVPPFDVSVLGAKGSLFLTRPSLNHYSATRDELLMRTKDLFRWMANGDLKLRIDRVFPLADAVKALDELESRRSTGKVLLLPPSE